MIFGETSFYFPIFSGISLDTYLWLGYNCIIQLFLPFEYKGSKHSQQYSAYLRFITGVACIGLCLFGIRGRMGYNPIKVSQAYYCEDPFLNQLGVNPVFNLLTSTLDDNRKETVICI